MESILALWSLERYDIVVQKSIRAFAYWAWWLAAGGDDWLEESPACMAAAEKRHRRSPSNHAIRRLARSSRVHLLLEAEFQKGAKGVQFSHRCEDDYERSIVKWNSPSNACNMESRIA
jgi:hypothetical protein